MKKKSQRRNIQPFEAKGIDATARRVLSRSPRPPLATHEAEGGMLAVHIRQPDSKVFCRWYIITITQKSRSGQVSKKSKRMNQTLRKKISRIIGDDKRVDHFSVLDAENHAHWDFLFIGSQRSGRKCMLMEANDFEVYFQHFV